MSFIDARRIDARTVKADVCIVGAGAAGIAIASELSGRSCRVALLESGEFKFRHRPQSLYLGEQIGMPNYSTGLSRFRTFGGSTTRWGGQCRPLDALDFEPRDGIPHSGWPFDLAYLEPYYRRAQAVCQLGPYDYQPSTWSTSDGGALPLDGGQLDTKIFQFSCPTDLGRVYRTSLAQSENVDVYLNANVVEIESDKAEQDVTGLAVATFNGKRIRFTAAIYVLACGGIENARLLLASNRIARHGLGNRHDMVGRFFMDHAYFLLGHFEPATASYDRSYYVIEDYDRVGHEQKINAALALSERIRRDESLNGAAIYLVRRPAYKTSPEYFSKGGRSFIRLIDVLRHDELPDRNLGQHLRNIASGARDIAVTLRRQLIELARPQPKLALRAVLETTPNPASRITLGRRRDHFGMPRVRVNWQLNAEDMRGLERLLEVMRHEFERCHLGRLIEGISTDSSGWPSSMTGGKHHMGTTRIHDDPRQGVVDADCRVHGISNLYISGSSVFPTGGYANPTLTIVALALRLAEHLKRRLRLAVA
jgi:choline dehydrogenase-like flavoprotein